MIAFFSKVREEEPDKKLVKPLALKNCSIYIFFTDFGSFSLLLTNIERMRKKHAQTDFWTQILRTMIFPLPLLARMWFQIHH